jgi:hypothetical protein
VEIEVEGHLLVEGLHRGGGARGRRGGDAAGRDGRRRFWSLGPSRDIAWCRAWVGRKRAANLGRRVAGCSLGGPSEPG